MDEPKEMTEAMRMGLAKIYSDQGAREYLIRAIAVSKKHALDLLRANKGEEARYSLARADALEQILESGKSHFIHFEDIRKKQLNKPPMSAEASKR